jgi:hypothetical protein
MDGQTHTGVQINLANLFTRPKQVKGKSPMYVSRMTASNLAEPQ